MIRFLIIGLISMLFSLSSCSQDGRVLSKTYGIMLNTLLAHSVPEMAVSDVYKSAGLVYLDARTFEEYNISHLDGAIWVGYDEFDASRLDGVKESDTLLVYCSVGYRSEKIAERIEALGYAHVYNLYGGIFEWKNRGRSVVDATGKPTEQVHAFDRNWGRWLKTGEKVYE